MPIIIQYSCMYSDCIAFAFIYTHEYLGVIAYIRVLNTHTSTPTE